MLIRACALAYFGFFRAQPALYAVMFDPIILVETEVKTAKAKSFSVLKSAIRVRSDKWEPVIGSKRTLTS
ncbi:MAG: hypothetical protein CGW95_06725 [Phenylobacterium zucineum]|nr:MAG: hypothetical protein CGW95_06725 [Phenylobacterium zucineum]